MANGAQKPPPSVVIQPAQVQEPTPSLPTLVGQINALPTNQIVLQQGPVSNGMANNGLTFGILGIVLTLSGPFLVFTCLFGWLFGLLGVIFGHIGAARAGYLGIGQGKAITGCVLGYITLMLYIVPILLLILEFGW